MGDKSGQMVGKNRCWDAMWRWFSETPASRKIKATNSFRKPTALAPRLGESRLHVEVVLRNTGIQKNQSNQTPSASRPRWLRASESRGYMWRWFSETPASRKIKATKLLPQADRTRSAPRRVAATCGGGSPKHRRPEKSKQPTPSEDSITGPVLEHGEVIRQELADFNGVAHLSSRRAVGGSRVRPCFRYSAPVTFFNFTCTPKTRPSIYPKTSAVRLQSLFWDLAL